MNDAPPARDLRHSFAEALKNGAVRRAVVVSLIVGTILNLINQGEALIGRGAVDWVRLGLTYSVPFFVSLHGALSATRR